MLLSPSWPGKSVNDHQQDDPEPESLQGEKQREGRLEDEEQDAENDKQDQKYDSQDSPFADVEAGAGEVFLIPVRVRVIVVGIGLTVPAGAVGVVPVGGIPAGAALIGIDDAAGNEPGISQLIQHVCFAASFFDLIGNIGPVIFHVFGYRRRRHLAVQGLSQSI